MAVFYFVMSLFAPALMLAVGAAYRLCPPEEINSFNGYRTEMSMKNARTWDFAQAYFSRLWVRMGTPALAVSAAVYLPVWLMGAGEGTLAVVLLALVGGQIVLLVVPTFILTERALGKNFDRDGNPR